MFKLLKMFLFLLVVAGCVNNNQIEQVREMAGYPKEVLEVKDMIGKNMNALIS
jgi:hypothetical protein